MDKIAIRADASNKIGIGHIMRCMTIAKELKKRNVEVFFITKYSEISNQILKENKIKIITLDLVSLEDEIILVKSMLLKNNIDVIIVDSYDLNDEYLNALKESCKLLICIDDNNIYQNPSDIIINPNIYAKEINYNSKNSKVKLLLGCKYLILREEFINSNPIKIKENVENVLVTMGGSDINNFTPKVLKSISNLNININVIVNSGFRCIEEIQTISKKNKNINLIYNPINMAKIMENNDMAISAGGSTIYELACLGIPTIIINQAKNQERASRKFNELNLMNYLGNYMDVSEHDIKINTLQLIANKQRRGEMNKRCIDIIYKDGVTNIVTEIIYNYTN